MAGRKTDHQGWGGWRPGAGRPRLPEHLRHEHQITVRLTLQEVNLLDDLRKRFGYESRSAFIRAAVQEFGERQR